MGKGWVKRWGPRSKGHRPSHIPALEVKPTSLVDSPWILPPSKSHIIRMLLLCALSKKKHTLLGFKELGEDAESMMRCLSQLGVAFNRISEGIEVSGVGIDGFHRSPSVLHAGNSGTALRLLIGLTSRFDFVSMVDGDSSLRNRNHSDLLDSLSQLDVKFSYGVEQERLPILVHGPWNGDKVNINVNHSSQPYSSLLLATSGQDTTTVIKTEGEAVSRRHSSLTIELMRMSGANVEFENGKTIIAPWKSNPPEKWDVPSDASMMAFPILACILNQTPIEIGNPVQQENALGHEILFDHLKQFGIQKSEEILTFIGDAHPVDIDLRDANDLLPPLAAILALSGGGRLRGASHAKHKESNRIISTASLLNAFGLRCNIEEDGLSIEGFQSLKKPSSLLETFGDHRIQMTAVLLATHTGGTVEGPRLHTIADPGFLQRFSTMPAEVLVKGIQR